MVTKLQLDWENLKQGLRKQPVSIFPTKKLTKAFQTSVPRAWGTPRGPQNCNRILIWTNLRPYCTIKMFKKLSWPNYKLTAFPSPKNGVDFIGSVYDHAKFANLVSFFTKACEKSSFHRKLMVNWKSDSQKVVVIGPFSGPNAMKQFLVLSGNPYPYPGTRRGLVCCSRCMLVGCLRYNFLTNIFSQSG